MIRTKHQDLTLLFESWAVNLADFFNVKTRVFKKAYRAKSVKEFLVRGGMRPLISEKNAKRLSISMVREFWRLVEQDMYESKATFNFPDDFMSVKLGKVDIDRKKTANYYFFDDYYVTYEKGKNYYKVTKGESYFVFLSRRCLKKLNSNLRNGQSY